MVKVKRVQLVSVKPRFKGSYSKRIAQACCDTSEVYVARACLSPALGSHAVRATSRCNVRHLTKGAQALLKTCTANSGMPRTQFSVRRRQVL